MFVLSSVYFVPSASSFRFFSFTSKTFFVRCRQMNLQKILAFFFCVTRFPLLFFLQFYSALCSNEKDTITWKIRIRKRGLQLNYNHSSSYLGLSCSRWCQLCDGTTQMITVKMVIGLLAFEERAESLLRRGFIIVPWGTICIMFFQPHGIKVFRRN